MIDIFDHQFNVAESVSSRVETAIRLMNFSRQYTMSLLEDLNDDDWYWSFEGTNSGSNDGHDGDPPLYCTTIAWQCGHIAMAQYGLTLFVQRGRDREIDAGLMSGKFRKMFMRGTQPSGDRTSYPDKTEILDVLNKVHQQMLTEVPTFADADLDDQANTPHAAYPTRYGALLFASQHEMLHAGQIGMLRRMMGKAPLR